MKTILLFTIFSLSLAFSTWAQLPTETPHAPDVQTEYLGDGVMQITLSNDNPESNNYQEGYSLFDALAADFWEFEGYKVYQVDIPISDLDFSNSNDFRLITGGQSDLVNEHTNLINHQFDSGINECVPVQMVDGSNSGLISVYTADTDQFTGQPFVEGEFYCFVAIAYAVNANGQSENCDGLSQYIESTEAADGSISFQCSTVPLSVQELKNEVSFSMFPNPTNGVFSVEMDKLESIEVFNLIGERVLLQTVQNESKTSVNVEQLVQGIYLVAVTDEYGNKRTKRLEIN